MEKVVCIGEMLIDFMCTDFSSKLKEGKNFVKKAGGAPANVAAAVSKLGGNSAFIGKVGNDPFGHFLVEETKKAEINTDMVVFDNESFTTLAFVSIDKTGERDFVFSRGADERLSFDEIKEGAIDEFGIIHLGSATALLGGELENTYMEIMKNGKKDNKFISFDPNYRVDLWRGREAEFIYKTRKCLEYADFVKMSDEEVALVTGEQDINTAVNEIHKCGAKVIAVTLGKNGTLVSDGKNVEVVGSTKITSVDSTGAGDAFVGGVLFNIASSGDMKKAVSDFDTLKKIVRFGNIVGALTCTKLGAIDAIPTIEEVKALI